jgi:hypothetical protein
MPLKKMVVLKPVLLSDGWAGRGHKNHAGGDKKNAGGQQAAVDRPPPPAQKRSVGA